jgi:hypothetical protein
LAQLGALLVWLDARLESTALAISAVNKIKANQLAKPTSCGSFMEGFSNELLN